MLNSNKKKIFERIAVISVITIITVVVLLLMLKYEVEGETNMPFELTKIIVVSSAEGVENTEDRLNLSLVQINDIYLQIEKNENVKKENSIKSVIIEKFYINEASKIGKGKFYRPSPNAREIFEFNDEYITNKIEYIGKEQSNIKELEIGNQGGIIGIRYSLNELGQYNIQEQVNHDGTLLNNLNIDINELYSKISFDIIIELNSGVKYKSNIVLDVPAGNILEEGICRQEQTNLEKIVFKRI